MEYKPSEFANVPFGTLQKSACSPQVDESKNGVFLIRTPDEIHASLDEKIALPICAYYSLSTLSVLNKTPEIYFKKSVGSDPFVLVPIFKEVDEFEVPPPHRNKPIDPELYKNQVSVTYLHFDAQKYIASPLQTGTYEFYLKIGDNKSNISRVKIDRKK